MHFLTGFFLSRCCLVLRVLCIIRKFSQTSKALDDSVLSSSNMAVQMMFRSLVTVA